MALNIQEKGFTISKTISECKKGKIWNINILCLQASNLAPKKDCPRPATRLSFVECRQAGRIIDVLLWTKYAVPRQIKPRSLKLTIRRGQSNFRIVSIFVSEEKGYHHVVSVGQLTFDFRSYCGRGAAAVCMMWVINSLTLFFPLPNLSWSQKIQVVKNIDFGNCIRPNKSNQFQDSLSVKQ